MTALTHTHTLTHEHHTSYNQPTSRVEYQQLIRRPFMMPPTTIRRHAIVSVLSQFTVSVATVLLASLLLTVVVVHATPITPPANVSLGWLGALTLSTNALVYGHPSFVAYQLALADINKNSSILPNTELIGLWADHHSDNAQVVTAAIKYAQTPGVVGLVGDYASAHSLLVQYATKSYKLPQISASSTAMDFDQLSNGAKVYPYFARTCPNNIPQAQAMTAFVTSMGWKKVAIINTNDAFGASGASLNGGYLKTAGVSVLVTTSFNQGDTDLSFQMAQLINSKARIFIYWGLASDLITLWRYINKNSVPNLFGDSYQWLVPQSCADNILFTNGTGGFVDDIYQLGQGVLGVNYRIHHELDTFQSFLAGWQQNPTSCQNPTACATLASTINPLNPRIVPFAPLVYDAVWLYAYALHHMIYDLELDPSIPANFPMLYKSILNQTFVGASGPLSLDKMGDRVIDFDILNLQTATKSFEVVAQIVNGKAVQVKTIQWQGPGLANQPFPLDELVKGIKTLPSQTNIALQVVTSFVLAVAVGLIITTQLTSHRSVMKASSPLFLMLFLVGIMCLASSIYARTVESETSLSPGPCLADLFLCNLGYTLIVGALLVKTYRLHSLFLAQTLTVKTNMGDMKLLLWLIGGLFGESMLLMALQLSHGMSIQLKSYDDLTNYWSCTASGDSDLVQIYLPVTITARFVLLLGTAICSWQIRNIPDVFNESKQLLVTVYNLLFLSILLPAIDATLDRGKESALIAYSVCVFVICLLSMAILFVPKLLMLSYADGNGTKSQFSMAESALSHSSGEGGATSSNKTTASSNRTQSTQMRTSVGGGPGMTRLPAPLPVARSMATAPAATGQVIIRLDPNSNPGSSIPSPASSPRNNDVELTQLTKTHGITVDQVKQFLNESAQFEAYKQWQRSQGSSAATAPAPETVEGSVAPASPTAAADSSSPAPSPVTPEPAAAIDVVVETPTAPAATSD